MLNGIGGRTIAEARQRISYAEFALWQAYRVKRGSLNIGMRVEENTAMLSMIYANSKIGKGDKAFSIYDFAPHLDEPEIELHELFKQMSD